MAAGKRARSAPVMPGMAKSATRMLRLLSASSRAKGLLPGTDLGHHHAGLGQHCGIGHANQRVILHQKHMRVAMRRFA